MANLDYRTPATVVITNNAVPVEMTDGGSRYVKYADAVAVEPAIAAEFAAGNITKVPFVVPVQVQTTDENDVEVVTTEMQEVDFIKYKTGDRSIQLFKTNTFITLRSGQSVTLVANSAAEAAFFADASTDEVSVIMTPLYVEDEEVVDEEEDEEDEEEDEELPVEEDVAVTGLGAIGGYTVPIEIAAELQLTAVVAPEDATNDTVIWTSSDEAVATVDANGLVVAVAGGTAVIIAATQDGGFTRTQTIVVNPGT